MKISKDAKAMAIVALTSAAALLTVMSKNINAGQGYGPGYGYGHSQGHGYGYSPGYGPGYGRGYGGGYGYRQPPAPPAYRYGPPREQDSRNAGYGSAPAAVTQTDSNERESRDGGTMVTISGMRFEPATLKVKAGDVVTWTNTESMPHTVTGKSGRALSSTRLYQGSVFKHAFSEPGTYEYYCALHPSMTGTIIVE